MINPIDLGGHTYEHYAIDKWLRSNDNNNTSPITRAPCSVNDIRPNNVLKERIDQLRPTVSIEVKTLGWVNRSRQRITIEMPLDATFTQFREQIKLLMRQDSGCDEPILLICGGCMVDNDETKLSDHGIRDGGQVHLLFQLGPGTGFR